LIESTKSEGIKTNSALAGGFGLALLGTTCCALPIALVSLGLGSAAASMASALPVLGWLSKYNAITFTLTAILLGYSWWRLRQTRHTAQCSLEESFRLKWQRRVLTLSTIIFAIAVFSAYALMPITLWLES